MKRGSPWLLASLLAVASCDEGEAQCGAACADDVALRLYKAQWAEGEHELTVRYRRNHVVREVRCTLELPSTGEEIRCEGDGDPSGPEWVSVYVDATINVHIVNIDRADIAIEVVPPQGESHSRVVRPTYAEHEICGQVCVSANEVVDLDE